MVGAAYTPGINEANTMYARAEFGFINKLALLSLLPFLVTIAHADTTTNSRWGFEVQVYPTGVIPGIRYEWDISTQDQLFARVAYNFTERSDFGEDVGEGIIAPGGISWVFP